MNSSLSARSRGGQSSAGTDTLVKRSSSDYQATQVDYRQFGGDAVPDAQHHLRMTVGDADQVAELGARRWLVERLAHRRG